MANTVTILSYANTFGEWVTTTNKLAQENNDLAANNYFKYSGTLYLNDVTLGLSVANNAVFGGQLSVQGVGSSFYVQRNARVDGTIYNTNTSLSLVTSGQANIGGPLLALSSGTGLNVANNSLFNGTIMVVGQSNLNGNTVISNTLFITGSTNISNTVYITGTTTVSNNVNITGNTIIGGNINVVQNVYANNTTLLNQVTANNFVANTSLVSPLIYSSNTQSNYFVANTSVQTPTLIVIGTEYVDTVSANTLVTTPLVTVTTRVDANSAIGYFGSIQAPYIISPTLFTTTTYGKNLVANTSVQTPTLVVIGTEYVDTIRANTIITTPVANVANSLYANNASGYFNTLQTTGQFTVGGNFVINGSTVYNANTFTLNAGSSIGLQSAYTVNRGITGANAAIRWNEGSQYWDINNVTSGSYYRILTTEQLDNTVLSTSTITAPTSNVANTLNNNITAVFGYAQSAYNKANAANVLAQSAYNSGNSNYTILSTYSTSGYDRANAANVLAQSAYNKANTGSGTFNGTTGQAVSSNGVITFSSTNGVTITGSANTLTINTPQSVVSGAAPTFSGANFSSIPNGALTNSTVTVNGVSFSLGDSKTVTAAAGTLTGTTLNSGVTLSSLTQVGTITSGTWSASFGAVSGANLTSLTAGNLTGTIPSSVLGNSNHYIGTTSIALNRSSASQTLTGVSIDGNSGTTSQTNFSNLTINSSQVLYAGNYNSYSPTLTGGNASGTWNINIYGNSATTSQTNFSNLTIGSSQVLYAGNYNSYSPTLTGGNASGTWSINVTGSSGYATYAGYVNGNASSYQAVYYDYASTGYYIQPSASSFMNALTVSGLNVGGGLGSVVYGEIRAGSNITAYYSSDKKLKENIRDIPNALDTVLSIGGKLFDWTDEYITKRGGEDGYFVQKSDFGVIAQDVQSVFPVAIRTKPDGTLVVDYEKLCALAFAAIRELKGEVEILKGK